MSIWECILINTSLLMLKKKSQDPVNLFLKTYNYDDWFKNEESTGKKESIDLSDTPSLVGDEEVKEEKGLKTLTPNKLSIRLQTLAQRKAGNLK